GDGSGDTGDTGEDGDTDEDREKIDITSKNASKIYDGNPLTHHEYRYEGALQEGHALDVEFSGSITQVGETDNLFTVTIRDENGHDVGDDYQIETDYGLLAVRPDNAKPILEIQVSNIEKTYNGEVIEHEDDDYWIPSDNLPDDHSIAFDIVGSLRDTGKIKTYVDESTVKILNGNGMDVTNQFNLVFYEGSIEVQPRVIEVTSFSAEKYYDGEPLTSDIFYLSKGSLVEGDTITVDITGTQTEVGSSANTMDSIQVRDEDNRNVTMNYRINDREGRLVVRED
ncbi:MAG: hypothetical protein ACOCU0_03780, partial [Bacillota bacterium]